MHLYANDLNIDTIVANTNDKPLLLFFHKPHCGYCKRMIALTLNNKDVKQEIEHNFVYVDIYIQDEGDVIFNGFRGSRRAFAQHLGYDFYPTSLFLDANGKFIKALPGAQKADLFMHVLTYISTKSYQKTGFNTYRSTLNTNSK